MCTGLQRCGQRCKAWPILVTPLWNAICTCLFNNAVFLSQAVYATSMASPCTRLVCTCLERCGAARSTRLLIPHVVYTTAQPHASSLGLHDRAAARLLIPHVWIHMQSTTRTTHRSKKQCSKKSTSIAGSVSQGIAYRRASRLVQDALIACVRVAVRTVFSTYTIKYTIEMHTPSTSKQTYINNNVKDQTTKSRSKKWKQINGRKA